jgi:hypothetical protein
MPKSVETTAPPMSYNRVAAHLCRLVCKREDLGGQGLFLPSVLSLSKDLNCPPVDIHAAMAGMAEKGYQFFMLSLDAPVTASAPPRRERCAS